MMLKGDPVGVHTEPVIAAEHASLEPKPGAMLCKSKMIVPAEVLKLAKLLMTSGPGASVPGRL